MQSRFGPPGPGGTDLVHQRVQVLGLGNGQGLDLGQAALGQAAQHPARSQLHERGQAQAGEGLERLAPAHRAAELGREQARPVGRVVVDMGVHVGHDTHLGRQERDPGEGLAQVGACPLHERRVERTGDLDRHDALGAEALGQFAGLGDRFDRAGDHDLTRCVVVGDPDVAFGTHAGRLCVVVGDAEQGGHRPGCLLTGACHRLAVGDHELDPVIEAQGTAGDERGVLAQAVAGAGRRRQSDALDRVEDDQAQHCRGQLGVLRLGELFNGRVQQQVREVAVSGGRCLLDDFPRGVIDPRFTHSGAL